MAIASARENPRPQADATSSKSYPRIRVGRSERQRAYDVTIATARERPRAQTDPPLKKIDHGSP